MPANTSPRFTLTADPSSNASTGMAPTITGASGDYTGAGANNAVVFTGSSNGSRLVGLHFEAAGSCTQSVARIYLNNGTDHTVVTNNSLVGKITLPTVTASNTLAEQAQDYYFPGGYMDLPNAWVVYVGLATAVSAGWVVTPIVGGKF